MLGCLGGKPNQKHLCTLVALIKPSQKTEAPYMVCIYMPSIKGRQILKFPSESLFIIQPMKLKFVIFPDFIPTWQFTRNSRDKLDFHLELGFYLNLRKTKTWHHKMQCFVMGHKFSLVFKCLVAILNQFLFVSEIQSNKSQSENPDCSQVIYLPLYRDSEKPYKRFCGTE